MRMNSSRLIDRAMRKLAPRSVYRIYHRGLEGAKPANQIISFPKCGRTWVRMMLGKALWEMAGKPDETDTKTLVNLFDATRILRARDIVVAHDDNPQWKKPDELEKDKSKFAAHKVVLLIRDPRDVVVSLFFEHTKRVDLYTDLVKKSPDMAAFQNRIHRYEGDVHAFIREEIGSLASIVEYLNIWERNRQATRGTLVVRYEDLHANAALELRRILEFLDYSAIPDEVIQRSVEFCAFDNMRKIESTAKTDAFVLKAADLTDTESFKTRKGKIGGFRDYLNEEDIAWMDALIDEKLSPAFNCYKAQVIFKKTSG